MHLRRSSPKLLIKPDEIPLSSFTSIVYSMMQNKFRKNNKHRKVTLYIRLEQSLSVGDNYIRDNLKQNKNVVSIWPTQI